MSLKLEPGASVPFPSDGIVERSNVARVKPLAKGVEPVVAKSLTESDPLVVVELMFRRRSISSRTVDAKV